MLFLCAVTAFVSSITVHFLLVAGSRLPRIGPVPFAAGCERANTLGLGISVFAIVFLAQSTLLALHALRRPGPSILDSRGDRGRKGDKEKRG